MELQIQVISKEIIKPSAPTPENKRQYQLSFLDQISPPVYNPWVVFYSGGDQELNVTEKSNHLKQSLSKALTYFYPLCGRINENVFVDCNDEGVSFVEAKVVNTKVSDVLHSPNPMELNKLVPFALNDDQEVPLGVQLNTFKCGGFAVGLCLSHKIGDALSTFLFMKTWAAFARGDTNIVCPNFDSSKLFPPKNLTGYKPSVGITVQNVVAKTFLFKPPSIEAIKAKYMKGLENQRPPSRVEVLSAFLWQRFMESTTKKENIIYFLLHAVNLRTRMDPPLPDNSFGNYYRVAMTFPQQDTKRESNLVSQMRESIKKVDNLLVKELQEGREHLEGMKKYSELYFRGEMVSLNITSLCRFPVGEADFGWGKPLWVASPSLTFSNLVVFMDDASGGGGVEALVHLKEESMAKLLQDTEFLGFVDAIYP